MCIRDRLDSRPHLLGFENGVYDMRMHEFREGSPDDYISFTTGRPYIPYNPHSKEAMEIREFLGKVFVNESVRKYVLDVFACVLDGGIRQEKFYMFTGNGCHAINTPILMYDGTVKMVQDIVVGDQLMGDDHTVRHVKELFRGREEMVRITPKTSTYAYKPYVVNQNHIMSLVKQHANDKVNIKVIDYIQHVESYSDYNLYTLNGDQFKFEVESVGMDHFYGFELDGNHLYATADGIIHHNSNGKSKILDLMQSSIGEYYSILPIALLTQKRVASNAAQSELERTRGRRVCVMQEPGESEKLNIGLMKELSGGDRIMARGLFKEPIEFKPQFKMFLTCNELPEVQSDDGGTWRRIRVLHFQSKFVERPDPKNPMEFEMDPELSDKFDRWATTFLSMLIHHLQSIDPKNITEPLEVRIATEGYKANNDIIGQYITEKLVKDPDVKTRMLVTKIYNDFKTWAAANMQKSKKVPDRNQFRAQMEKTFGEYPTQGWKGIKFVAPKDEDGDSDAE
jgi:P4 family phage/plasmid primase-like protien